MMMEQQTVLNRYYNAEMQYKWKSCVRTTCYAFRTVEWLKDSIDRALEAISVYLESFINAFRSFTDSLLEGFKFESYPLNYPPIVYNFKINTKGFPRPIIGYARSRC